MPKFGLICIAWVISPLSIACELFDAPTSSSSVLLREEAGLCISWADGIQYTAEQIESLSRLLSEPKADSSEYWSSWALNEEASPLLSQSFASNYVGVGVWVPNELKDDLAEMDTEQWLMSHGLQLSLGFGDKTSGKPRMRFDYRWHDRYDGDMMVQVELPF